MTSDMYKGGNGSRLRECVLLFQILKLVKPLMKCMLDKIPERSEGENALFLLNCFAQKAWNVYARSGKDKPPSQDQGPESNPP